MKFASVQVRPESHQSAGTRPAPGEAEFVPQLIDDNSGVGVQVTATDATGDGLPDIVVANKQGIFVHSQARKQVAPAVHEDAQPRKRRPMADGLGPDEAATAMSVPPGFSVKLLAAEPDATLRAQLAPAGTPLLVHAGRLSSEKRVDLLADMLAELRSPAVLAVAGSGPAHTGLKRRADRLGVGHRMIMLGHIAGRADLACLMATGDCFVHPNPDETYGLAPLEALATGTRVVAARGGRLLVRAVPSGERGTHG
jgi:glycosyltransferase involved in cell wall biosynthesis